MTERSKHLFEFEAARIAGAANDEALYHDDRLAYWKDELEKATQVVEKTASVRVERVQQTGGWRPSVVVFYGDPAAYARMQEAGAKIQAHQAARDRYASDADLYETQGGRVYALDADDVAHFRFNGRTREL